MSEEKEAELRALALTLKQLMEKKTARDKWLKGGIVFVDAIPRSPSGKILRRVLRDEGDTGHHVVQLYDNRRTKL